MPDDNERGFPTNARAQFTEIDHKTGVTTYIIDEIKKRLGGKNIQDATPEEIRNAYDQMIRENKSTKTIPEPMRDRIANLAFVSSGAGGYFNQIQTFLTCLDRYAGNVLPVNSEFSGLTFITRPRLCLQSSNLRSNRRMVALDTINPTSMAFMIRCLLDTNFHKVQNANQATYAKAVSQSPLVDEQNPFLTPLCNALTSISGFPDMMIQTQTTEGGFMSEAQQFAIGGDDFNRGAYNLTLNFKDIQHGPISAMFFYWLEYIRCVTRGSMVAYADDIDEQRLNYTVSIYRFCLDPTKTYITDWCKCTGCFPTSLNLGSRLQVNEGEGFVQAAATLSVPFVCNKVEYRDYAIFMDFNTLMRRYCPTINLDKDGKQAKPDANGKQTANLVHPNLPKIPITNYRGLPYITSDMHGPRLEFRRVSNPVFPDTNDDLVDQLMLIDLHNKLEQFNSGSDSSYSIYAQNYIPEFYRKTQTLKETNMRDFIRKVVSTETDSKGFDVIK